MSNFNFVTPFYDGLVKLVFGRKLWDAQKAHLNLIKPNDRVLILGGGSGRILEWLPSCEVTYVEQSAKMLKRAKQRGAANFIQSDFMSWKAEQTFDWVICPFFLDCFPQDELTTCELKLMDILSQGRLVVIDFAPAENKRQTFILKSMHVFFRLFAGLKSKKLIDINGHLLKSDFHQVEYVKKGMVYSAVYQAI
ncbi:MAG: methyltransferase domain-containing protein [Cyclobacteriaceae bacterium]